MKEYVTVPDALLGKTKELQKYLELCYEYAKGLRPKPSRRRIRQRAIPPVCLTCVLGGV